MKIGVLSDTHDNKQNFQTALEAYRQLGITQLLHLGDMTSPPTAQLTEGFRMVYLTGNMDRDPIGLRNTVLDLHPDNQIVDRYESDLEGLSIVAVHGHREPPVEELAGSGKYDLVLTGHTHRRRDEMVGNTRIINPGALGGVEWESRSFCVLDLETGEVAFHELP